MAEIPPNQDILPDLPWTLEKPEGAPPQKVEIYYFALTTCAYCKRGLEWLRGRKATFRWLYLDEMPPEKKIPIKTWIKTRYGTNMGTPFLIFRYQGKDSPSEGFDPDYWAAKIK